MPQARPSRSASPRLFGIVAALALVAGSLAVARAVVSQQSVAATSERTEAGFCPAPPESLTGWAAEDWTDRAEPAVPAVHRHDDPAADLKASEHGQALALAPILEATAVAATSGLWSDAATWEGHALPKEGDRVWIPPGKAVVLDFEMDEAALHWMRVDGRLRFDPTQDTALRVVTLLVGPSGSLEIGSRQAPVLAQRNARLSFADRGPRDRVGDPFDLSGGLIALGDVRIHGTRVTPHALPARPLVAGLRSIPFCDAPRGWRVGDRLLVPGVDPHSNQDEGVEIAAISEDGTLITLDQPLAHDHHGPAGSRIPVGHLSRNVVLASETTRDLRRRGHVLLMHRPTGISIENAAFLGLGRTDARVVHTMPKLDPRGRLVEGSDDNTQARYAVHFHNRSGARRDLSPHVFRGNVIVDSPKHGLVNHGGHLAAIGNVTYNVDGSHFFAENGSEIGIFANNLAVRSTGSPLGAKGYGIKNRMYRYDFGHGGHGYWAQSGGVDMVGNYAFGHRGAGFILNSRLVKEEGRLVHFAAANLRDPSIARGKKAISIRDVPFLLAGNQAAGCRVGLEIWNHQRYTEHGARSRIEDSFFWAVKDDGVLTPYSQNLLFRNVTVLGRPGQVRKGGSGFAGINQTAASFEFENVRVEGFRIGIDVPTRGRSAVRGGFLANQHNIRARLSTASGFDLAIDHVEFGDLPGGEPFDIYLMGWKNGGQGMVPKGGDLSRLLEPIRITLASEDPARDGKQLYFFEQAPRSRPFAFSDAAGLADRSQAELAADFGLAVGGVVAPSSARRAPRIWGLLGPPRETAPRPELTSARFTRRLEAYAPQALLADGGTLSGAPIDLEEGWNLVVLGDAEPRHTLLVYGDRTPPSFEMDPRFRYEIHPADIPYGLRIKGFDVDVVDGAVTKKANEALFDDLKVGPDGFIRLRLEVRDLAGNLTTVPLDIRVTERAVRRGPNAGFFRQAYRPATELPARVPLVAGP